MKRVALSLILCVFVLVLATGAFAAEQYQPVFVNERPAGENAMLHNGYEGGRMSLLAGNGVRSVSAKAQAKLAITAQPKSVTVALGTPAQVTIAATGEGLSYEWYVKAVGKNSFTKSSINNKTYSVEMTEARNGNQIYCVVKDKHGNSVKSKTVTIKMQTPLAITAQPKPVNVAKGAAAKVTIKATGDGLTYEWYVKAADKKQFTKSAVTGDTYAVEMVEARNGNQLYCVVKDKYGNSVKSKTVTLKMQTPLAITAQPKSVIAPRGKTAKVTVAATGDGLSYEWYVKAVNNTKFNLSSVSGDTYAVEMTDARNGNQIYCVVKDQYGKSVTTNTVTIKMPDPVIITSHPKSVTVEKGKMANVTVTAKGEGLRYTWFVKPADKQSFSKSSVTTETYSVEMTEARNGNQLYCVVEDKYGNSVHSLTATIRMPTPLTITRQPKGVVVAKGAKAETDVAATGDGLTYEWYVKSVGNSGFNKSSITGETYSVEMTEARNGNQVYCLVKDRYGNSVKSDVVTIKMQTPLVITRQPYGVTVRKGATAKLTVAATGDGLSFDWYVKPVDEASFSKSSITGDTYSVEMTEARNGTMLFCIVKDQYGNSVKSDTVTIRMPDPVAITAQPKSVTVAKGAMAKLTVTAVGDGLSYEWYVKAADKKQFTKSTITSAIYAVEMTDARNGNQIYCVVKDQYGNSAKSDTVTIQMPDPVVITLQPQSVTVEKGATAKTKVSANGEGLTYAWYLKAPGKKQFNKSSVTGDTYSVEMTAARDGSQLYCVVKDKHGNSAKSNTVTLKMKKALTITKQPKSVAVAKGATAKATVTATGDGLTYVWYVKPKNSPSFRESAVNSATYAIEMTEERHGIEAFCLVRDQYGNVARTEMVTLKMQVPLTITAQPQSVTVARGATAKVTVHATGDGLSYTWYLKAAGKNKFSKSSVTGNTYAVEMTGARNGNQLYCVVQDQYGNKAKTNTVIIKALPMITITAQPRSVTVAKGAAATVSVAAAGDGLRYEWYLKPVGKDGFQKSAVTGNTYSVEMSPARNGNQLFCLVKDKYGNSVKTNTVTIRMLPPVTITAQPRSVTVAKGAAATVSVTATGDGLRYEWYLKPVGKDGFQKSAITGNTYSVEMSAARNGNQLYCLVKDQYGNSAKSNTVTIKMLPMITITAQPRSVTVAKGERATVSVAATGEDLRYEWYLKAAGKDSFQKSSMTGDTYSVEMTDARNGNQLYCLVKDKYGNSVKSNAVTIQMHTPLTITKQPQSATVAKGETATATVTATGDGLSYTWYVRKVGQNGFGRVAATGNTYSVEMTEASNGMQAFCVVWDQSGNGVESDTVTFEMQTSLAILTQPQSVTVAKNENATVTVNATGDGLSYEWYVKPAGASNFSKSAVTGVAYTQEMTEDRDGEQVYCVVKDRYGNTETTHTVTLEMEPVTVDSRKPKIAIVIGLIAIVIIAVGLLANKW